jgi:hypothetical protein
VKIVTSCLAMICSLCIFLLMRSHSDSDTSLVNKDEGSQEADIVRSLPDFPGRERLAQYAANGGHDQTTSKETRALEGLQLRQDFESNLRLLKAAGGLDLKNVPRLGGTSQVVQTGIRPFSVC